MPVNSNQYLQGINQTTGTGVPIHSAVAGDRYTDTATGITYQYTTSWQTVSYSAGSLTYFTEAQSTASPNATVNVDSLTAVASTTNADFAVRPKGTGSVLASIPDGTATGGNKRGVNAVDLQTFRDVNNQVASGDYSIVIGGQSSKATQINSTVIGGFNNTASGTYSVVSGSFNTASGTYSNVSGGYANGATGNYSTVIGGSNNTASGTYAVVGGQLNSTNGQDVVLGTSNSSTTSSGSNTLIGQNLTATACYQSTAFGAFNSMSNGNYHFTAGRSNALTSLYGSVGLGKYGIDNGFSKMFYSGYGWVSGDNQTSKLLLNKRTTDATPTILIIDSRYGIGADATNQLTLKDNNSIRFKGTIIGRQSGSTNTSAWDIDGIIQRGAGVGTTTLLISNVNVVQNTPAWGTPTLTANTTFGCLTVTVIGAIANIQWTCVIDTAEVIYA
jgi:hypothetical protein